MTRIIIKQSTIIKGVPAYEGDRVETDDSTARLLIGLKRAVLFTETPVTFPAVSEPAAQAPQKQKRN